jgi:hypothetical protein
MVYQIAGGAVTAGSTNKKLFGALEVEFSRSDQKSTMIFSGLTRPNRKKLRKFLECRC